jgi:glycosyltransferase involved in cell wall biosynthesis
MTDSISTASSIVPMVTVCCVTFNQADTIRRAVDGILNQQTDFVVELLIHDDVSTDGTRQIVEEYVNQHPGWVTALLPERNQYSQGVNVMAKLRQLARGKYIALCEGDDYWTDSTKLAQQVACMEANPDVVMTGHKVIAINSEGEPQRFYRSRNPFAGMPQERDFDAHALRTLERVIPTSCRVFRNIQINLPLEASKTIAGDAFLQAMLADHGSYRFIATVKPSYYTVSGRGIWSQLSRDTDLLQSCNLITQLRLYFDRVGHKRASSRLYRKQTLLMVEIVFRRVLRALGLSPLLYAIKNRLPR